TDLAAVGRRPAAVGGLARQEILRQAAVPVLPVLAADLVHGVGGVVMAIVEVRVVVEMVLEIRDPVGDFLGLIFAGEEGAGEARGGPREAGGAALRHVGETTCLRAIA